MGKAKLSKANFLQCLNAIKKTGMGTPAERRGIRARFSRREVEG